MKLFHSHIYFEPSSLESARSFYRNAEHSGLFHFVRIHERPIGPHITGMIEAHFTETTYAATLDWLNKNRGTFSVLIHPDTGDDLKDHTIGVRWLGKEIPLNFDFFELIQNKPELRIHQTKTLN